MAKTVKPVPCGPGHKMPIVGFGTWLATDPTELELALNTALEVGYRHIDTATVYNNEHIIGKVISQWICSGKLKREDLFITTKLPFHGIHRDRVEKYLTQSLQKLAVEFVDLYLIHFPFGKSESDDTVVYEEEDHKGIWEAMEEQVWACRTKSIGLSNFNKSQVANLLTFCEIKPANLQIELNVFLQQPELVEFCRQNEIGVTAYSPLGNPGYNKFLKSLGFQERQLFSVLTNPVVADIAKSHQRSTAQIALRFLMQKYIVIIPKSVTPSRISENFDVFDFVLDDEEMKRLESLNIGEEARIVDWKIFPNIENHPAYPFGKG
ncbi:aldo-keto reductase family 1 member A1-like [Diabrotica virgifera virgifera]|uniref:NADP-dependent oxidoreductase domain-containing protein n=1 Tax=Diabrotica virgifera virgifera TaxID=50390 RepID=A0ABM5L679_DIAVI|nr:aldo-keto reductase family 1 member A1-like [Diabrotica virgifera virgifera]